MHTSIDMLREKGRRLRIHSLKATTEAGSGHPSSCLSAADLMSVVFFNEMRFDPKDPRNPANDRFVLSKGHAAPLLWAAYAEAGIIDEKDVLTLRQLDSNLEGHPTPKMPWVDVATGSLGQGLSVGLGNALAAHMDDIPYNTYVLLGDGECAEGSVWEAAALASYYKAATLYAIVDVNGLGQSQRTMDQFDVNRFANKFRAFGWFATIVDGHNYAEIVDGFERCRRDGGSQPRVVVAKTFKGKGVSTLENLDGWHGKPIPKQDLSRALEELSIPSGLNEFKPNPRTGGPPRPRIDGTIEIAISRKPGTSVATREAYGDALVKVAEKDPRVVALDGDTKNSTYSEKLFKAHPERFLEMFIAEQNMVGVSIGEDGPSQMGLEDIAMFRAVPGSVILYPSDAVAAEQLVVEAARHRGICYIRTTRPKTPVLYANDERFPIGGSKVLRQSPHDRATVVAAGITLHEALKAASRLDSGGTPIRVIDAYSVKPIDAQSILRAAKETGGRIVVVEDHYEEGGLGDAVLNAVGNQAKVVKLAVREIPHSGPPDALLEKYGIGANRIVETVKE